MTDKLFDDFIQDKLYDHKSSVPGGMWSKIEAELDKEKEDRKILLLRRWSWAAAILVLSLSSAAWFYYRKTDNSSLAGKTGSPKTPAMSGVNSSSEENSNQATDNTTAAVTEKRNQPAVIVPEENKKVLPDIDAGKDERETASAPAVNSTSGSLPVSDAPAKGKPGRTTATQQAYVKGLHTRGIHKINGITIPAIGGGNNEPFTDNNTTDAAALQAGTNATATSYTYTALPSAIVLLNSEAFAGNNASSGIQQFIEQQANKFTPVILRCPPVRNAVPNDLYIEAYVSPDKVFRHVSANNGATNYLANRDSSLSLRTSFSAGIRISKALTENLLIKTGVQYSQVNENYKLIQENEQKTVTVITTHTVTNANGQTVTIRDTSSYEQSGYLQKTVKNRYKSIDIPLLLSYEWGNDSWRFATNAGPIFNLRSWYSGEMPDTLNQPVKNGSSVYRNNIGVGLYAGFSIIKTLNENMDLFAEPYFRYNISDMTQKGQAFNQKFNTTGLSVGIRYRLNGGQRF